MVKGKQPLSQQTLWQSTVWEIINLITSLSTDACGHAPLSGALRKNKPFLSNSTCAPGEGQPTIATDGRKM